MSVIPSTSPLLLQHYPFFEAIETGDGVPELVEQLMSDASDLESSSREGGDAVWQDKQECFELARQVAAFESSLVDQWETLWRQYSEGAAPPVVDTVNFEDFEHSGDMATRRKLFGEEVARRMRASVQASIDATEAMKQQHRQAIQDADWQWEALVGTAPLSPGPVQMARVPARRRLAKMLREAFDHK